MRASPKLCAAMVLVTGTAAFASLPFLGCGSGDDDSGTGGATDASVDGTTPVHVDSGVGDGSAPPIDTTDGGTDASDGDAAVAVVCPASAPADFSDAAVAAACTRFVYLAGGDNTRVIASVDEGATWASQLFDNIEGDDVINNFAVYQGITTASSLPGVFQSSDPTGGYNDGGPEAGDAGITFTPVSMIKRGGFSTYGGEFAVNATGVFFTDNQGTYITHDEVTWSQIDAGIGQHWYGSAASASTYVIFQDGAKFRSYDGTALTDGVLPITPGGGNNVAFGGALFVAVGGSQFATSGDAKTWSDAGSITVDGGVAFAHPSTILWDGARFLVYDGTTVAVSPDTQTWTFMTLAARVDTAATSEGHFVATGTLGGKYGILLSSDGITWTMAHVFAAGETANINGWRVGLGRVLK